MGLHPRFFAFILTFSLMIPLLPGPADALQASVLPQQISPGDPFMVRITGVTGAILPEGSVFGRDLSFSSCGDGCFLALGAADFNTNPGSYRISLSSGGEAQDLSFQVIPAVFPTIRLTLPKEKVTPVPEDMKRIAREEELLKAIWPKRSGRRWEGPFLSPLSNELSTAFGTKRIINGERVSIHRGLDIRGKEGEAVKASNTGRVVLAEELFFGGNTLILDHGQGIYSIYMHLSSFTVRPGDLVTKGDVIAFVGSTGRSSGPHLHFGIKVMETNANPVSLMKLVL